MDSGRELEAGVDDLRYVTSMLWDDGKIGGERLDTSSNSGLNAWFTAVASRSLSPAIMITGVEDIAEYLDEWLSSILDKS